MATTSAISRLLPSSPTSQRSHPTTPRSARSRTPSKASLSAALHSSPSRQLSPNKARATPLKAQSLARSTYGSPAMNTAIVKKVSFSPQRTQQPPRAWERRPATPYVPRDERQKIWKRVPLAELGVDANRPSGVSRSDQEKSKDYARTVKKLKIRHNEIDDEDKENVSFAVGATVQSDTCDGHQKRALRPDLQNFVTMRVEDDEVAGSPKKKLRQPLQVEDGVQNEEKKRDDGERDPSVERTPPVAWRGDSEHEATSKDEGFDVDAQVQDHPIEKIELAVTSNEAPPLSQQKNQVLQSIEHIEATPHTETSSLVPTVFYKVLLEASEQPQAEALQEELRSSSPPTIIAENVTVDELAARHSPNVIQPKIVAEHTEDSQQEVGEQETRNKHEAGPRRISDDEAAFLREFMSRTKAERAAREQVMEDETSEESSAKSPTPERGPEERTAPPVVSPLRLDWSIADQAESGLTSPLRRSKRAAVTSIPRPQALPNAIQLKRANGNEFIFTANNASSTGNVAIVTRSNTKKNKGVALNVSARLDQLLVGKANEEQGEGERTVDSAKMTVERTVGKNSKKRKASQMDSDVRSKKVLRWNDENLLSYQEAQTISDDDMEDIEDSSQETVGAFKDVESTKCKLTLTCPSSKENTPPAEQLPNGDASFGQESAATDKDMSQTKVRRVRRGMSGSVNGTPAPKTRSQQLIDDEDDVETNTSNEDTTSYATAETAAKLVASAAPAKKSRMPVLSSARRGAAASASARKAAALSSVSSRQTQTSAKPSSARVNSTSDKSQNIEGTEKGDVQVRRRLRMRL